MSVEVKALQIHLHGVFLQIHSKTIILLSFHLLHITLFFDRSENSSLDYLFIEGNQSNNFETSTLITVRKVNSTYYFFIDKELKYEGEYRELYGDKIFMAAAPGQEVWISALNVYALF